MRSLTREPRSCFLGKWLTNQFSIVQEMAKTSPSTNITTIASRDMRFTRGWLRARASSHCWGGCSFRVMRPPDRGWKDDGYWARFVFELRLCKDLVDAFWFDDLVALICVRLIKLDQRRWNYWIKIVSFYMWIFEIMNIILYIFRGIDCRASSSFNFWLRLQINDSANFLAGIVSSINISLASKLTSHRYLRVARLVFLAPSRCAQVLPWKFTFPSNRWFDGISFLLLSVLSTNSLCSKSFNPKQLE